MKHQASISSKDKSKKKNKVSSAAFFVGTLKVNWMSPFVNSGCMVLHLILRRNTHLSSANSIVPD